MNSYGLIGGLALLAITAGYGVWERGTAEHWHSQYVSLQASYQTVAISAKADALKQEIQDKVVIQEQSNKAIQQAQSQAQQAQNQLADYKAKLKADARMKDPGHVCSGVVIPQDLLPGAK